MEISDKKALILQSVSRTIKQLAKLDATDSPNWTVAFEKTLSKLGNKELEHINFLLGALQSKIASGSLPS